MLRRLPHILVRLGLALLLAGFAAWSALTGIDRSDAAGLTQASDASFRARMAAGLPSGASHLWYAAVADRAMGLQEMDTALAVQAYDRALQMEPRDGEMWGRYAYALYIHGAASDDISRALTQSYTRMPIGNWEYRKWRLRFVHALWDDLPDSLHRRAAHEALAEDADWVADRTPQIWLILSQ